MVFLVLAILYHLCNVISFFITYVMYTCYACLVLEYSFTRAFKLPCECSQPEFWHFLDKSFTIEFIAIIRAMAVVRHNIFWRRGTGFKSQRLRWQLELYSERLRNSGVTKRTGRIRLNG